MKYEILTNGNLQFTLDYMSEDLEMLQNIKEFCGDADSIALPEFLEDFGYSTNGHFYDILPEDVGALTDAPMLSDEKMWHDGAIIENSNVWWYPEYMVSNWLDVLISNGSVIFTKA